MRATRLFAALLSIPLSAVLAYNIALEWNGDRSIIDAYGSLVGLLFIVAAVFGVSRLAADVQWRERAGTALALSVAYFILTWARFGDPDASIDGAPHLVWLGACIAAFMPAVVLIPTSKWIWSWWRGRDLTGTGTC